MISDLVDVERCCLAPVELHDTMINKANMLITTLLAANDLIAVSFDILSKTCGT
jgi:hypothetical protein